MRLSLLSNAPDAASVTLLDDGATDTGYALLQGSSFGSPVWQHQFSGPRGTQGARASQGTLPNREVLLILRLAGATKDALAAKMSALAEVVDDLRRFGGLCRWRSKSQTYFQSADVLTASLELPTHDNRLEQRLRAVVQVHLVCGPYMLADPMDFADDFSVDNVNGGDASYAADAGALTNLAVSAGRLNASANHTTENRLIWTGTGYTFADHEATVRFTPAATISSFKAGVVLKRIDAANYLEFYVDDTGAVSRLRIDKVVATARTNLASINLGDRIVNGQNAWCRGRIEGNVVYAEYFHYANLPTAAASPTTSTSYPLTTTEAATFGSAIEGKAGLVFTPQAAGAYIEDFEVLPFTYRNPPMAVLDCHGAIPGDAPALASARMALPSGFLSQGLWGMLAWAPRVGIENLSQRDYAADPWPWNAAAVAGVTGAATSALAITVATLGAPGKYGTYVIQVVTPATANTGTNHPIHRRFRKGVAYTGTVWVRASAGTTTVRMRLGVSGDIASSTAVALSATWTQHSVTWTPTVDVDLAYLAVEVTAATATTFQIDGAAVYAGTSAPVGAQLQGLGAAPPLAVLPFEGTLNSGTTLTRTADAAANGGFSAADSSVAAGGESYTHWFAIDTSLAEVEDYSQDAVTVEVFARVMLSAAFTGGVTVWMDAYRSDQGGSVLSITTPVEGYSSASPKALVEPSSGNSKWRMVRLGTLNLTRLDGGAHWLVRVSFGVAAGTNLQAFALDDLYVIPVRSRFASPTGKYAGDGYPDFISSTAIVSKTVASDLSGTTQIDTGGIVTDNTESGVGGSLLELPPGQISVLAILSSLVPDDPIAQSGSEDQDFPSLHLSIRPRFHWLRDA